MVEVALFADLLTLKEALAFDRHVHTDGDFQLTSCCCPVWIAMVRRVYRQLMPHVPGAVSPMVAAGRAVKALHPDALTIFVGPCLAKKSEAREPDLAGAVDFVLTFQEVRDIFRAAGLRPEELEETDRDHSSRCGRLYARAGASARRSRPRWSGCAPAGPSRCGPAGPTGCPPAGPCWRHCSGGGGRQLL